jgi:hypothetical protein
VSASGIVLSQYRTATFQGEHGKICLLPVGEFDFLPPKDFMPYVSGTKKQMKDGSHEIKRASAWYEEA